MSEAEPVRQILAAIAADKLLSCAWAITTPTEEGDGPWTVVEHTEFRSPGQGWKLHVSATSLSSSDILDRALPVLLSNVLAFKVPASIRDLDHLNEGHAGLSQIGKFITIYPQDDEQAKKLAIQLHDALDGLRGPEILSDSPFSEGSLVHARYGAFLGRSMRTPIGEAVMAILSPDGTLVPDVRSTKFEPPSWVKPIFDTSRRSAQHEVFLGRYVTLYTISESARGTVRACIDLNALKPCLVKHARRDALLGDDGLDARDALKNEFMTLVALAADDRIPRVHELFEFRGDLYLIMEHIEGRTLESYLFSKAVRGERLSELELIRLSLQVADILTVIHNSGFLHRDIKPENVIIDEEAETVRIIDFESSFRDGFSTGPHGFGTIGYMSPSQKRRDTPAIGDDIYSFGALLYMMATVTTVESAYGNDVRLYNPHVSGEFIRLIERCIETELIGSFKNMTEVRRELSALALSASIGGYRGTDPLANTEGENEGEIKRISIASFEALLAEAKEVQDTGAVKWISKHQTNNGIQSDDINVGSAGSVLALAEFALYRRDDRSMSTLSAASRYLASTTPTDLPGLYVGESGVAAALLRASQVLEDNSILQSSFARADVVGRMRHTAPDLFNGSAGRLRFHLMLWDETKDSNCLLNAIEAGEFLLTTAIRKDGCCWWVAPEGYGSLSGSAYCGYAHGAAGIADALLDLWEATGDRRYLEDVQGAARWLEQSALPTLPARTGLDWPDLPGGTAAGALWCHGATGIGSFFSHAAAFDEQFPNAHAIAVRAANTVAEASWWQGATRCHGLSGGIEFLLDMAQRTNQTAFRDRALILARYLARTRKEEAGLIFWPSELRSTYTPDYMVGYAGSALTMLRLSVPDAPHQLSRAGFRYRGAQSWHSKSPNER